MSEVVKYAVTVLKPRQEVYSFWRDFENLPRFSRHLNSVRNVDATHTEWSTEGPNGPVTWTAEIIEDIPEQRIAWKSVEGSEVDNHGIVQFFDAPGGRGTEVKAYFTYKAPWGWLGKMVATATGNNPLQEVAETMRRFKALLECGEFPVIEGQPSNQMRGENKPGDEAKKVGTR